VGPVLPTGESALDTSRGPQPRTHLAAAPRRYAASGLSIPVFCSRAGPSHGAASYAGVYRVGFEVTRPNRVHEGVLAPREPVGAPGDPDSGFPVRLFVRRADRGYGDRRAQDTPRPDRPDRDASGWRPPGAGDALRPVSIQETMRENADDPSDCRREAALLETVAQTSSLAPAMALSGDTKTDPQATLKLTPS